MAIANAVNKFLIPTMGPALLGNSLDFFDSSPRVVGSAGCDVGLGVIVGGVFQALIVGVQIWRLGFFPRITMKLRTPGMWIVLRNMIPWHFGVRCFTTDNYCEYDRRLRATCLRVRALVCLLGRSNTRASAIVDCDQFGARPCYRCCRSIGWKANSR